MNVRPFKLIRDSELKQAHGRVTQAVSQWSVNCLLASDAVGECELFVVGRNMVELFEQKEKWLSGVLDNGEWVGLKRSPGFDLVLLNEFRQSGEEEKPSGLIQRVINRSLNSLIESILASFLGEEPQIKLEIDNSQLLAKMQQPGSGFLGIKINLANEQLIMVMGPSILTHIGELVSNNASGEELESAVTAFGSSKVAVSAYVGEAEIEVGQLPSMKVGNVLMLDSPLSQDIELTVDGQRLCHGALGVSNNRKAIRIKN